MRPTQNTLRRGLGMGACKATLDGAIYATPAALGTALYIRTDMAIYRIEDRSEGAAR